MPQGPIDPDPDRIFRWASAEARRNEERHAGEAKPMHQPKATGDLRDGFIRLAQADQEETAVRDRVAQRDEARRHRYEVASLLESNGIPPRYREAALHAVDRVPDDVRKSYGNACQDLRSLMERPGIIALLGNRGAGKTFMGCGLVNAFCRQGRHAVYAKAMDYFLRLDEAIAAREAVLRVEVRYLRPELLVLDAMEERADTQHKDRMLSRLIDKRYDAQKSTVLISNETEEHFNARVGESIADRIRDDGQKIECVWPSLRGRIFPAVPK